jgi:hypothetical protein
MKLMVVIILRQLDIWMKLGLMDMVMFRTLNHIIKDGIVENVASILSNNQIKRFVDIRANYIKVIWLINYMISGGNYINEELAI